MCITSDNSSSTSHKVSEWILYNEQYIEWNNNCSKVKRLNKESQFKQLLCQCFVSVLCSKVYQTKFFDISGNNSAMPSHPKTKGKPKERKPPGGPLKRSGSTADMWNEYVSPAISAIPR